MKLKLSITTKSEQKVVVTFADVVDLLAEEDNSECKIQQIITTCNNLYSATRGHVEEKKRKVFLQNSNGNKRIRK